MKKQIILIKLCLLAVLISVSAVSATNYYVNDTNGLDSNPGTIDQPFKTIETGVNYALDGDTVIIASGTYTGNDNNYGIPINENLIIQGAGVDQTTIICEEQSAFFIADGFTVTIKDLTIKNGECSYGPSGGAIRNQGNLTVQNCKFINNTATESGGAIYNSEGNLTVKNCIFINNRAGSFGGAIYGYNDCMNINNCEFTSNRAEHTGGAISSGRTCTITGSNFYANSAGVHGGAIYVNPGICAVKYSRLIGNTASNNPNEVFIGPFTTISLKLNWWGFNNGPATDQIIMGMGASLLPEIYTPWLVINIDANPSIIYTGQTSTIIADVYKDSEGSDHNADAAQFFSGPQVTFTTNLGNVVSKSVTVNWIHGRAIATLRGDEGAGIATITAADVQTRSTTVTILEDLKVNAATVGMQKTGIPIIGLVLAILAIFAGLVAPRRK